MKDKTIAEIKHMLTQLEMVSQEDIQLLKSDQRKGVQKLLSAYEKRRMTRERLNARYDEMCQIEKTWFAKGCEYIAGVDEAGRGP
ncbi:Ribonuclease H [Lentibacillus sp. JNUCC-1]|nr:Ribonuclease H [Lentibacillus sp. JNUCC-1]